MFFNIQSTSLKLLIYTNALKIALAKDVNENLNGPLKSSKLDLLRKNKGVESGLKFNNEISP